MLLLLECRAVDILHGWHLPPKQLRTAECTACCPAMHGLTAQRQLSYLLSYSTAVLWLHVPGEDPEVSQTLLQCCGMLTAALLLAVLR